MAPETNADLSSSLTRKQRSSLPTFGGRSGRLSVISNLSGSSANKRGTARRLSRFSVPGSGGGTPRRSGESEHIRDYDLEYKGAYAKLMGFLEGCRVHGCTPLEEEQFNDLAQAVENLTQHGSSKDTIKDHFKGHEQTKAEVLICLGISVEDDVKDVKSPRKEKDGEIVAKKSGSPRQEKRNDSRSRAETQGSAAAAQSPPGQLMEVSEALEKDVLIVTHTFVSPWNLIDKYRIDVEKFAGWVMAIATQYVSVPYHNWNHALDVFFFSMCCMMRGQADRFFNFQDILACGVACLAHDVGHWGVSNNFLIASGSQLALTYNDQSVLESMHTSICFQTMRRPGLDFLDQMGRKDWGVFRSKVVGAILATDMTHHFEFIDRFTSRVNILPAQPFHTDTKNGRDPVIKEKQKASKADRRMLLHAFVHMADLGKNAADWLSHSRNVVALEQEFFAQGDQERELGLPISPMADRRKDSAATGQSTFLLKVVQPLLEPFARCLNDEVSDNLLGNLVNNHGCWQELLEIHGKRTAGELVALSKETADADAEAEAE